MSMQWHLIHTKPNAHLIASKHLKRQNFDVFLPLVLKTARSQKTFVTRAIPLFPGYLFVGSHLKTIPWSSINSTRGVSKIVKLGPSYRPIERTIVEGLKSRCDANNIIVSGSNIKIGDLVKVEKGPLSNFVCKVEKIDVHQRVWVLLELMQQKTPTHLSISDVSHITT